MQDRDKRAIITRIRLSRRKAWIFHLVTNPALIFELWLDVCTSYALPIGEIDSIIGMEYSVPVTCGIIKDPRRAPCLSKSEAISHKQQSFRTFFLLASYPQEGVAQTGALICS